MAALLLKENKVFYLKELNLNRLNCHYNYKRKYQRVHQNKMKNNQNIKLYNDYLNKKYLFRILLNIYSYIYIFLKDALVFIASY